MKLPPPIWSNHEKGSEGEKKIKFLYLVLLEYQGFFGVKFPHLAISENLVVFKKKINTQNLEINVFFLNPRFYPKFQLAEI
jgi:hypothetical protein